MVGTLEEKESRRGESLETLQRRKIAESLHMKPEDVTDEFLDEFLEEQVYPSARLNIGSELGGYDNSHLAVLTRNELDEIKRAVEVSRDRLRKDVGQLKR